MRIAAATVLLTGATGGIGRTLAHRLSQADAQLVLSGPDPQELEELSAPYGARAVVADLTDAKDVARLTEAAGACDVIISNAGLPAFGHVNLRAGMLSARLAAPRLVAKSRGHLVFSSAPSRARSPTARAPRTTRPSSACATSPSASARTCTAPASACPCSHPPRCATRACSPPPTSPRPPCCPRSPPTWSLRPSSAPSSATPRKSRWRPARTRVLVALGAQFPTLSERVQRRLGAHRALQQVGDAHHDR